MNISTINSTVVKKVDLKIALESEQEIEHFKMMLKLCESYLVPHRVGEYSAPYMPLAKKFFDSLNQQLHP